MSIGAVAATAAAAASVQQSAVNSRIAAARDAKRSACTTERPYNPVKCDDVCWGREVRPSISRGFLADTLHVRDYNACTGAQRPWRDEAGFGTGLLLIWLFVGVVAVVALVGFVRRWVSR